MQEAEFFLRAEMDREVRAWLHDDAELIANIDVDAVSDSLLQNEVKPEEVNTSARYDLVQETVEMFDSKADER